MNIGTFLFTTSKALMNLGTKLYDLFTKEVSIGWLSTILKTFGVESSLPDSISLSYILVSASAILILTMILYNLFK